MSKIEQQPVTKEERELSEAAAAVSVRFLSRNLRYKPTPENNSKLSDYIYENKLEWSVESLETALKYLESELDLKTLEEVSQPAKLKQEIRQSQFPWPTPLTAQVINSIPLADYKIFIKDPRFREQVAALGLHRG